MKNEDTFVIDGAYLRKQAKLALVRSFMPFNPGFWRDYFAARGPSAKFDVWLNWPEQCLDSQKIN